MHSSTTQYSRRKRDFSDDVSTLFTTRLVPPTHAPAPKFKFLTFFARAKTTQKSSTMACCKKEDKGQCGVIGRSFFYICGLIGLAFSLLTIFSCEFLNYSTIPGTVPSTLPQPFTLSEQANVGLFRWDSTDDQFGDTGCVYYTKDEIDDFDSTFRTAQTLGFVSCICVVIALLLSTIEFVCCRFCCSKFFLSFFMICAMVTQALTFALWTADSLWYVA